MSFINCIMGNPALNDSQKARLVEGYNERFERYRGTMGDDQAAAAAAQKFTETEAKVIEKKNENIARDALAWQRLKPMIDKEAENFKALKARAPKGTKWLFGGNARAYATKMLLEKTYVRHQALERRATLALADLIEEYRPKHAGLTQNVDGFIPVVRAALGEKVDDPHAMAAAKAIRETFDSLHRMYDQAGGIIGKIDNYFPQSHNPVNVGRVSYEDWSGYLRDRLDRTKMIDERTGMPITDKELDRQMRGDYEQIRTNGLAEAEERALAGQQSFGRTGGVAARRSASRFYQFKNADAYLEYNREYGFGDDGLFDAMNRYISSITRDTAIMQDLGPNTAGQLERLIVNVRAEKANPQTERTIRGMYDVLAGRISYHGELPLVYRLVEATQNNLRTALLGGAPVSAISDSFFAGYAARINGVPSAQVLGEYFKILNPLDNTDRMVARQQALIASSAAGDSLAKARYADDYGSRGLTGWLAGFTNKASGLGLMTDAIKQSAIMGTMGYMRNASLSKISWADTAPAMKEAFARWDMGEKEYAEIMKSQAWSHEGGAEFVRPEDVSLSGFSDTARKYEMWLVDMSSQASNEPRLLTRAITSGAVLGDARRGTALRATASSLMMFKSFGLTVTLNHVLPAMRLAATGSGADRFSRIGSLIFMTTLMGAMAQQAKQVVAGKTPRPMDDGKFWQASLLQGGGLGVFGDFLFADQSRFGQSMTTTAAGPVASFVSDTLSLVNGNLQQGLYDDEPSNFPTEGWQYLRRYAPVPKLWYTRLLTERLMLDQVERMIDPNYDKRMQRMEKSMEQKNGQRFYWEPGDASPE